MECDSSERTPEVDLLPHVCTRAHMNMHTPIHTQRGVRYGELLWNLENSVNLKPALTSSLPGPSTYTWFKTRWDAGAARGGLS